MYFITNRRLNEDRETPTVAGNVQRRKISFKKGDPEPQTSIYFAEKTKDGLFEIGSTELLDRLKKSKAKQILLYIHGFNNQPDDVFANAANLQALCNGAKRGMVEVVPLIWPCADRLGIVRDYFDDQDAADQSAFGFARLLGKFFAWRDSNGEDDACYKHTNVLAHSMGNRVLRLTIDRWATYRGHIPQIFRNVFMVAADVVNETLEPGASGQDIPTSGRNVVVYFAGDDAALRASKVSNVGNKVVSRRLGHTGPEDMGMLPSNVYAVDCDNFNNTYDFPKGHTYFMFSHEAKKGGGKKPGSVFTHLFHCMQTGRVPADRSSRRLELPKGGYKP